MTKEADDTDMLTVWFSLKEATVEQGCLTVIPESHREGLLHHCPDIWGLEIPEKVKDRSAAVPQPTQPGDVLFLHKHTCHSSLPNKSDEIRWSYDLRYNPIGQASGRGAFPGFVARSHANPERVLTDSVRVEPDVAGCQGRPRRPAQPVLQPVEQGPRALRVRVVRRDCPLALRVGAAGLPRVAGRASHASRTPAFVAVSIRNRRTSSTCP